MMLVILTVVLSTVAAALVGAVLAEVTGMLNWATFKILRVATLRLPARLRETRAEEWAAELDAAERARLFRLRLVLGFLRAASRLSNQEPEPVEVNVEPAILKLHGQVPAVTGHFELVSSEVVVTTNFDRTISEGVALSDQVVARVTRQRREG